MYLLKSKNILLFLSLLAFVGVFYYINFLASNQYVVHCDSCSSGKSNTRIRETFANSETSDTVDLPLTTTTSCKNFCGPTARCAITGQQCMADIDCYGCQPLHLQKNGPPPPNIAPNDDSGKLTVGVTPQYSTLTNGYGTKELIIDPKGKEKGKENKPAMANFGVNIWSKPALEEQKLFDKRYKPFGLQFMPGYEKRYTLTGEFIDDGPLPSNY